MSGPGIRPETLAALIELAAEDEDGPGPADVLAAATVLAGKRRADELARRLAESPEGEAPPRTGGDIA